MSISSKSQLQQAQNQSSQSHTEQTLKKEHQIKPLSPPIFDQGKLHEYFNSIKGNLETSFDNDLKKQVEESIYQQIELGQTTVLPADKKNDLSNKANIVKTLQFLQLQTSVLHKNRMNPETLQQQIPCNILTKEQHSRYVSQIFQKRIQSDMKHQEMVQRLKRDRINESQRVKKEEKESIQKQKQMRRQRIKVNLEQKRIKHELALQFQIKTAQQYKNILGRQFLHQKMEQKYNNEIVLPELEQKKKKLKQIRQISKAFNIKDISRHEKEYEGKRNKSYSERPNKNEEWIYKPPQKTDRLIKILKEEEETIQQRKEQRKRKIQWKMERVQSYSAYLKQNFVPKINEQKHKEIEQRIASLKPNRKQSLSQRKEIGLQYLKEMKELGKKSLSRVSTQKKSSFSYESSDKETNDYLSSHRKDESFYQEKRIRRISNILESEGKSSTEKINQLKKDSQRLGEAYNRREQLKRLQKKNNSDVVNDNIDLLLGQIHAKMGIINIYNQMGENAQ